MPAGAFTVVIPARMRSTRLPGKMLADVAGRPLVAWVVDRARASGAARVVVEVPGLPPVEVPAATVPCASRATAPTVPMWSSSPAGANSLSTSEVSPERMRRYCSRAKVGSISGTRSVFSGKPLTFISVSMPKTSRTEISSVGFAIVSSILSAMS